MQFRFIIFSACLFHFISHHDQLKGGIPDDLVDGLRTTVVKWGRDSRIWESWNDCCLMLQRRILSWCLWFVRLFVAEQQQTHEQFTVGRPIHFKLGYKD
uniref:Secreted protein n=1 Tax=Elaeophora elaphi TaxID=1147741 RepID=A0A0R3S3L8_9BILA